MQIDNLFHKEDVPHPDKTSAQPSAFQVQALTLTYTHGKDAGSIIEIRGEQQRMKDAAGPPPAASQMLVPEPRADFRSPDAIVTHTPDGTPLLHPYEGQARLRDYPGGKGTPAQIEQARRIISRLPGPGEQLFELFDQTYNSRVGENRTPGELKLNDAPRFGADARYQLHFDVDLYVREDHGPLMPARDLRPKSDVAPGDGKRPGEFYAVVSDQNNTPLDVLTYDDPGTGSRYKGQYVFKYHANTDGTSVTSVVHLVPEWMAKANAIDGKAVLVGTENQENVLADVTKYYYDSNHHCVQAELYPASRLKYDAQPEPSEVMQFNGGRVNGTVEEKQQARDFQFFDLLGPRLP